jgi:hypothetical protein
MKSLNSTSLVDLPDVTQYIRTLSNVVFWGLLMCFMVGLIGIEKNPIIFVIAAPLFIFSMIGIFEPQELGSLRRTVMLLGLVVSMTLFAVALREEAGVGTVFLLFGIMILFGLWGLWELFRTTGH